jgi:hypothetical protein
MNKTFLLIIYVLTFYNTYGQKLFPKFSYVTIQGDTISNKTLLNKSTIIIVGHISCPGMLFLLRDLQKSSPDSIQTILLLENTKAQILAFNANDTNDIWGGLRQMFKIAPLSFSTVTFCDKQKLERKKDGTVKIKNQCNKLKVKYAAFEVPKIYAINNNGQIITKQTGWYFNTKDPLDVILQLFKSK